MKIAHFGTFDVANYGDLLFPLLLERRLSGQGIDFVHVSPVGGAPAIEDCKPVIGFEEALAECESWDAIVLGGGALGHGDSAGEVEKYRGAEIHTIAYPGLWLLPALIAHLRGIPLIWNAPGIPGDFSEERKRRLMQWAAWQATYLTVRDRSSAGVLAQSLVDAAVVPDTAVEVSHLWSAEELRSEIERLEKQKDWPPNRYLTIHLNERYAGTDLPALAAEIKQICAPRGVAALLIAIGDCHGDTTFAHQVLGHIQDLPAFVFTPDSLRSVAAAIQFSDGYIGSSLHGAITAYSLGRPFLIVAPASRPKFAGFLDHIGAPKCQVPDWAAAAAAEIRAWVGSELQTEIVGRHRASLEQTLSEHWKKLSTTLALHQPVAPQAAPQFLEKLSEMPPEWFPFIPILEKAGLFAPVFEKHRSTWMPTRQQLQNSAFVAAAAYRRLDLRHQIVLADLHNLQAKLVELNRLRAEQQEQRKPLEKKFDALTASIHKRDGRIEALEEQRVEQRATIREREKHIAILTDELTAQLANAEKRHRRITTLEAQVDAQATRLREGDISIKAMRRALAQHRTEADQSLHSASKDLVKLGKWSDRLLQDLEKVLRSNRWQIGCWLSLKRTGEKSNEAQRLARLIAVRPRPTKHPRQVETPPLLAAPVLQTKLEPSTDEIPAKPRPAPKISARGGQFVSIVIPVYNAHEDLVRCLESVLRHSRSDHSVIAIDDASPDERIGPLLRQWETRQQNFRAVRNDSNRGYTVTVNRGCELAGPGDLILLNSDTIVTPHWVEQMAACAYSRPDVATVTAISNAAGAFSFPEKNAVNDLPAGWSVDEMAAFVERTSQRIRPIVPTGNGFCLYLTAAARSAVGLFDAENFPRGYGEENDFCFRASAAGLVNLIDDATYIFHRRSASFGETKVEVLKASRAMVDRLHPSYTEQIREWSQTDALDPIRAEMRRGLERAAAEGIERVTPDDPRPCLLFVLHDGTGGTRFTSKDLSDAMAGDYRTILLLAGLDCWTLCEYFEEKSIAVRRYAFAEQWRVDRPLPRDRLAALREICADYGVGLAHVRHLLASGPELLDTLRRLQIPIVFSFHDFYTICPTIQLLDETRIYCAGRCTAGAGDCALPANWFRPPLPWLKHRYVHEHQRRMAEVIPLCDAFVTTSEASRDLITEHFPALNDQRFTVIEHGRDLPRLELAKAPVAGRPLRAVFFGALNPAKGVKLVVDLLERNREANNPIELHILGLKHRDFDPARAGAIYHGPYQREELPERIRAIGATVSLVPSLWPETYCHVLTESWAMGLPVLASDIGTLRERVLRHGGGWLLPVGDSEMWLAKMRELIDDRQSYAVALQEIREMQFPDIAWMARQYAAIYQRLLLQPNECRC